MSLKLAQSCNLCGRQCKSSICNPKSEIKVSSYTVHHGEEPMISGTRGSGAIFFTNCNMRCVYCQNYEISQNGHGNIKSKEELADIMLILQKKQCHNINLVSPTHFMPQILESIKIAIADGLKIPVVYNTNGYDSLELLKELDGMINIYMPDFKYSDNEMAKKYSGADNYVETAKAGIAEMLRQVGPRNLLVRHLVLPNRISGTFEVLDFLASIATDIRVSLMAQYSPQHKASQHKELNRKISALEYNETVEYLQNKGFENAYIQELISTDFYLPDFMSDEPFKM